MPLYVAGFIQEEPINQLAPDPVICSFLDMHMLTNAQHIYFAKENDKMLLILHVFLFFFNLNFARYIKLNFRKIHKNMHKTPRILHLKWCLMFTA